MGKLDKEVIGGNARARICKDFLAPFAIQFQHVCPFLTKYKASVYFTRWHLDTKEIN
jgi:hypothetical protein